MKKHDLTMTKESLKEAQDRMAKIFDSAFPNEEEEELMIIDAIIRLASVCETPEELAIGVYEIAFKYAMAKAANQQDIKIFSANAGHASDC